ncbi:MAG: 2-amino-4-hydroxy-6-hydroxymethyldihydropteridine diphosphokinase [Proteobacteria bacterium]|nr:2-amino-4-hydroxy-6-hydroxymethyldihydropteridine diphosphokinase [Pseudomonadota bacterium]
MKREHWRPAYIALGSNLQNPQVQVQRAFEELRTLRDTQLLLRSALYATAPMGVTEQPPFVNAAAGLLTRLSARELLEALLAIERGMGRERRERWGPRVIDLDLIWITGPPIDEPDLKVPHPGVPARNFVLYPLADIAPSLFLPGHGRVEELAARVDSAGIRRLPQEGTSK